MENQQINIVLPVLNEEKRFEQGIKTLLSYLQQNSNIDYHITVMDNGSTDKTPELALQICKKNSNVSYMRIEERGVGAAFRNAVETNGSAYIGYMDIDMSTDIDTLGIAYKKLTEDDSVDIINASRYSRESNLLGRTWMRNFISYVWMWMLRIFLKTRLTDSICGFKFFRKNVVESLVAESNQEENGWFFIIEMLIRAERKQCKICELPVTWTYNSQTKVNILKVTVSYLKGIKRLRNSLKMER